MHLEGVWSGDWVGRPSIGFVPAGPGVLGRSEILRNPMGTITVRKAAWAGTQVAPTSRWLIVRKDVLWDVLMPLPSCVMVTATEAINELLKLKN